MIYVSEGLLYVCFAILTGTLLLKLVPDRRRPDIRVPDALLTACALLIPILSFVPIHQIAWRFSSEFELSYVEMIRSVLLDVNSGKAWLWTLLGSLGLAALLGLKSFRKDRHMPKVALFVTFLLIVWLGYASHASSLSSFKGLVVHASHFAGFSVWIGILFVVAWFSRGDDNWPAFLRWFSPVAIACVLLTLIAGFTLMTFTTPEYVNSWILPYGQLLLIKHLLILPLLLFAYTNGFGYKKRIQRDSGFRPKPWLKAESLIALLVLAATAALGQQAPPHVVKETLQYESPSAWFTAIYKGPFSPDLVLQPVVQIESILMLAAALLMGFGLVWTYRAGRLYSAFLMGLLIPVFGYLGLMFTIA